MKVLIAALFVLLASWLALAFLAMPFVWFCVALALFCGYAATVAHRSGSRLFWIYFGAVVVAWGIAEGYLGFAATNDVQQQIRLEGRKVYLKDGLLGWVLPPNTHWRKAKYHDDEPIFDVSYSTDSRGLRVGPERNSEGTECVLFFGGSFTFGEGVEDAEAMPFQVGRMSGWRVLNLGVNGYGPHHMLAALDFGRVEEVVDCEPRYAVYQTVNDHVARAIGRHGWGKRSPRYLLSSDGSPLFAGNFADTPSEPAVIEMYLRRSHVYRRVLGAEFWITESDLRLYVALIRAARERLVEAYPDLAFHVIYWGTKYRQALADLETAGIDVHYIDDILPGYNDDELSYMLSPHDWHPGAATHERIADFVVNKIMTKPMRQ